MLCKMTCERKLKSLNLAEKFEVIEAVKSGAKKKDVAEQYGLPFSTLSMIIRNEQKILQKLESGQNPLSKRLRVVEFPEMEDYLIKWFKQCISENVFVTGSDLKEKAKEYAKSLGYDKFKASSGWLQKFKTRHGHLFQKVVGGQDLSGRLGNAGQMFLPNMPSASSGSAVQNVNAQNAKKPPTQQPSISITPLPRNPTATVSPVAPAKPGDTTSKNTFVICEICDGYIKDLEQLRNHMQWIHKIKIHPKMIYNRPPLNCQKCQFRFFTDQGLERHLLGSHGLVTSSMQEAANKSKDSGRCPVCGRVYQWKLLNHVARDHNMTLKPAHLSYKCTVCTATFGMYKQFENHVYSAHSVVAKRVMDKKSATAGGATASPSNKSSDQMKSLKINDEITIIPQPTKTNGSTGSPSATATSNAKNSGSPSTSKSR